MQAIQERHHMHRWVLLKVLKSDQFCNWVSATKRTRFLQFSERFLQLWGCILGKLRKIWPAFYASSAHWPSRAKDESCKNSGAPKVHSGGRRATFCQRRWRLWPPHDLRPTTSPSSKQVGSICTFFAKLETCQPIITFRREKDRRWSEQTMDKTTIVKKTQRVQRLIQAPNHGITLLVFGSLWRQQRYHWLSREINSSVGLTRVQDLYDVRMSQGLCQLLRVLCCGDLYSVEIFLDANEQGYRATIRSFLAFVKLPNTLIGQVDLVTNYIGEAAWKLTPANLVQQILEHAPQAASADCTLRTSRRRRAIMSAFAGRVKLECKT
mmetsp:Transcript_50850/g.80603  ORF Transcript_50850/g.80603 Transcript_50850/m.80603 type:complete len:323 (+) Transcript_50850:1516-2484(+)